MAPSSRGSVPPGPITDLFDRLDQLHLAAGRPSMREIATRAGRDKISSSTVHNVFRATRVPRWNFLQEIVTALGGDTDVFLPLWQAAWQAENEIESPLTVPSSRTSTLLGQPMSGAPEGLSKRIWSPEIPPRNPNFTGRAAELETLRTNLTDRRRPQAAAQVVSGVAGIGKTEIVTEYVHRYLDQYEIICWIRAERPDQVRDALVRLGQRLEVHSSALGSDRDRMISAVLRGLETGVRLNWLLVYDNAGQPRDLSRYMPAAAPNGHVIITSRLSNWPGYISVDEIEILPFTKSEATSFLRQRVPELGADRELAETENHQTNSKVERLAELLGHLPVAIELAAADLTETGQSIDDYIARYKKGIQQVPNELRSDFSLPVMATWAKSTSLLTADAENLLNLCAFFSPEPIAVELLLQNAHAVSQPSELSDLLSSRYRFRRALRLLSRLSLIKVDWARDEVQVQRVVREAARGRLRTTDQAMFANYQRVVGSVLAASNPGNPDRRANDAIYDLSLPHLEFDDDLYKAASPELRQLTIDQVRRLELRGRHIEAVRFGQDVLQAWKTRLGPTDLQVLRLAVEVAIAMRLAAQAADARQLTRETLATLRANYGEENEVALLCANVYGADLRAQAQYEAALEWDQDLLPKFERVFGPAHERTLNVGHNIASDFRWLGRLADALRADQRTFEGRRSALGENDMRTLVSRDAVAVDLRFLGRYEESLDIAREVARSFAAMGGRDTSDWLHARKGFAASLRKAGHHWDALQESEDVVRRYTDHLGPDHVYTLRAANNLVNDRRAVGDLAHAEELGREIHERCRKPGVPLDAGYAVLVSLASVLRAGGHSEEARQYDAQARDGLIGTFGALHLFSLVAGVNYATDLAACGDIAEAAGIGQETLDKCRQALGEDHPVTLMAAANLALDEATAGERAVAEELLADTLRRYEETLTAEHPEARAAAQQIRLTAEIEPY